MGDTDKDKSILEKFTDTVKEIAQHGDGSGEPGVEDGRGGPLMADERAAKKRRGATAAKVTKARAAKAR